MTPDSQLHVWRCQMAHRVIKEWEVNVPEESLQGTRGSQWHENRSPGHQLWHSHNQVFLPPCTHGTLWPLHHLLCAGFCSPQPHCHYHHHLPFWWCHFLLPSLRTSCNARLLHDATSKSPSGPYSPICCLPWRAPSQSWYGDAPVIWCYSHQGSHVCGLMRCSGWVNGTLVCWNVRICWVLKTLPCFHVSLTMLYPFSLETVLYEPQSRHMIWNPPQHALLRSHVPLQCLRSPLRISFPCYCTHSQSTA